MDKAGYFGETLQTFLSIAGVKRSQLAAYLGYDISYISRWISGKKLPTLKGDYRLFDKIAFCILKESGETGKENLTRAFEMDPGIPAVSFTDWMSEKLADSYKTDKEKRKAAAKPVSTATHCYLSSPSWSYSENQKIIIDTVAEAMRRQKKAVVSFFTMPSDEDFKYHECRSYWDKICALLPEDTQLRIQLSVDFSNHELFPEICRDVCIFNMMNPQKIKVEIYQHSALKDRTYSLWICCGTIFAVTFRDAFLDSIQTVLSDDPQILKAYEMKMNVFLRGQEPLIQYDSFSKLLSNHYLIDFMLQTDRFELYNVIPPAFLPEEHFAAIHKRSNINLQILTLFHFSPASVEKGFILIYESALVRFFTEKCVSFGNSTISLTTEEALSVLHSMRVLFQRDSARLRILRDSNPLLNSSDCGSSLLIGKNHILFLADRKDCSLIGHSNKQDLIAAFMCLFTSLWHLPAPDILSEEESTGLMKRGLEILSNEK